jgi:hypothetical protein
MTNPFDGRTVLVVEDDGLVREDVADWLRQQGWIVLENALGAGRCSGRLRLLFTDINLAHAITGWDVWMPAGHRIRTLQSFMPQEGRRIRPASCLRVFSVQACVAGRYHVRGLCLSPIKNGLT